MKQRDDGLDYLDMSPPGPGELHEVAPGVHWLRMPLPFSLAHINLWLLEDGDGWTIVDCGINTSKNRDLWKTVLSGPTARRQPRRLIATHYHPDHFGLAGWLVKTWGLSFHMTESEWLLGALLRRMDEAAFVAAQRAFMKRHGLDHARIEEVSAYGQEYKAWVAEPPPHCRRLRHGQDIRIGGRDWRVIVTEGHTSEQACLYCAELGVLIAGDQVLPQITPNVSVWWFKDGSAPLAEYLNTLDRFDPLPADTLVLPSHRQPFRGLHLRLKELRAHHEDRLEALAAAMRDGQACSAADVMPAVFPQELEGMHIVFALGETIAHLEHLVDVGSVTVSRDADGATRYRLAGVAADSGPVRVRA